MTGGDSNPRAQVHRLLVIFAAVFLATAAVSHLHRTYAQKLYDVTGRAQWIWAQHRMAANLPLAFFAARDFDLPPHRLYTRIKILGDPEYTLYVNGREVAGRLVDAENRAIDRYDISELVKDEGNRIVIAVRSPKGVGGLIASIDIAPETENWIVTNGAWRIHHRWTPGLLQRDPGDAEVPMIIGEPPIGRWNYLDVARRELDPIGASVLAARETTPATALIPRIETKSGVAVAVTDEAPATAFDFGFTNGRARLTIGSDSRVSRAVPVRFANLRSELGVVDWNLRPVVFAPGERVVTTPEEHRFRYVMVVGRGVRADVVRRGDR